MQSINDSSKGLHSLQSEAGQILGQQISLEAIHLPANSHVRSCVVHTRSSVALGVSSVEFFSHLQPNTKYHRQFHEDEHGNRQHRERGEIFAFQTQGGAPALSVVLADEADSIAVIKRMITSRGEELSWSALLQELGVDPSQFKDFVEIADGIRVTRKNAPINLTTIASISNGMRELQMRPNPAVSNLHSLTRLTKEGREMMKRVLPNLLDR